MESVAENRIEEPRLSGDWSFEEVEEFDALLVDIFSYMLLPLINLL